MKIVIVVVAVAVILILFGPRRLPDLGKSFRKSMKAFSEEAGGSGTAGANTNTSTGSDAEGKQSAEGGPKSPSG